MKTLQNHIILFDDECPMCKVYTKALVKTGMLDNGGRASYQNAPESVCPVIDRQRAVNEIALVNQETGEVTYGIKSLFKVIGNAFPLFRPLFSFTPFIWLMSKVYAFVAYNRRVIMPPAHRGDGFSIQPTFKVQYRVAYLIFTWFCAGSILAAYAHLIVGIVPLGGPWREYLVCAGQIVVQGIVISIVARHKFWSYLGNMMTISFAGSLLLLLPLAVSHWLPHLPVFYTIYFLSVAWLMLLEHIRRMKLLELGFTMTITWILFRIVVMAFILK